jgi:ribonuclease E
MTENNPKDEKTPSVRKAKKGAWWKSLSSSKQAPPSSEAATSTEQQPQVPATAATAVENAAMPLLQDAPPPDNAQQRSTAPNSEPLTAPPSSLTDDSSSEAGEARESALQTPPVVDLTPSLAPTIEPDNAPADAQMGAADASEAPPPDEGGMGEEPADLSIAAEEVPPAKKRRSRRGGKKRSKQAEAMPSEATDDEQQPVTTELESETQEEEDNDVVPDEPADAPEKPVVYKLLINAEEPEECRIALVEDGRLESFHVNTVDREATKNNIYKGRIVSIEANLQAAFVDIGTGRNGFLPFNEIHPEYYRQDVNERVRSLISQQQWKKLKIEEVMQRGQEVLVQVVKEVTGNKGANMTTYLSLPGRFLVLMPGSDSAGISRKIVGEERRSSLRDIMSEFEIPEGIGYIIRTASVDITQNALQKDFQSLLTLWEEIKLRGQTKEAPALVYEEQDTVVRFLRDHFIPEIQEILVDTQESLDNVNAFIDMLPSKQRQVKVRLHRGSKPIFNQFNVEEQIESIFKPQVPLPSGGSIVINPTEALVAIDVNSGRTSKNADFEETIFLANMEAAAELARQLRLRDLGGLVVVDFIDMRNKKHIREVERQVKMSMKRDKAKVDISKISRFGLMQISRQKMGAPIEKGSYRTCEYCQGRGVVRSVETLALYYLRRVQTGITRKKVARVECRLPLDVAQYLLNKKRAELVDLENKHRAKIDIVPRYEMKPAEHQIDFLETDPNH